MIYSSKVRIYPRSKARKYPVPVSREIASEWYMQVDPQRRIIRGIAYRRLKRAFDLFLIVLAMPVVVPLLALIAALVYLDSPGPVFYRQMRTGRGGRRFPMYKFRTMVPNAEAMMKDLMHLNELQWPDFKITNDPRITRVGKVLRKTSMDELPQLINVLIGDMSLVGPRPTIFGTAEYNPWHTYRLEVEQGVTGLWQIEGRARTQLDARYRLDIAYTERASIWLDIQILFRTIPAVLKGDGAY